MNRVAIVNQNWVERRLFLTSLTIVFFSVKNIIETNGSYKNSNRTVVIFPHLGKMAVRVRDRVDDCLNLFEGPWKRLTIAAAAFILAGKKNNLESF